MSNPRSDLIIPAWNEAARLQEGAFLDFVARQDVVDLRFVDDGSTDATPARLEAIRLLAPDRIVVQRLEHNVGKGEAVRRGLIAALDAGYPLVGYLDADLSAPLDTALLLRDKLLADPALTLALGSRIKLLGWRVRRSERRHYLGRIFATFASLALGLAVYDTQCGAKALRAGPATRAALAAPFISRWLFDVELVARLRDAHGPMREVPLPVWDDPGGSSVGARDFLRAPFELWRIWAALPPSQCTRAGLNKASTWSSRREVLPLVCLLLLGGAVLWWSGLRGWYPHDEGLLGQSAHRVLRGEMPHRDFGDPYTGGLSLLHAGAFWLFGERLDVIRRAFDLFAWAWTAMVFLLARRWLPAWGAVLASSCALLWSIPVYPAAVPSWYVLFFVTAALLVLVRDDGQWRVSTLIVAGFCLGLAVLVKVTGLYAVAGICVAFGRLRQLDHGRRPASAELMLGSAAFILAVLVITRPADSSRVFVHITLPTTALVVAVLIGELQRIQDHGIHGDRAFRRNVFLLSAGVAIAILPFALWLALGGGLTPLLASLAAAGGRRAEYARFSPPKVASAFFAIPLLFMLMGGTARFVRRPFLGALLGLVWIGAWQRSDIHRVVWQSVRGLLPLGSVILAVVWLRRSFHVRTERPDHILIALTCTTMALSQFPFAAPVYYLYLAPLVVVVVVSMLPVCSAQRAHGTLVAGALAVFAGAQVLPGTPLNRGYIRVPAPQLVALPGVHGGLLVPALDARVYGELLALLERIGGTGPIWSGPDAPEVAFLAWREDRNSTFFAFLESPEPTRPLLGERLMREGVRTVVIQTKPSFSPPLSEVELTGIANRFPESEAVGTFIVRWRTDTHQ